MNDYEFETLVAKKRQELRQYLIDNKMITDDSKKWVLQREAKEATRSTEPYKFKEMHQ